MAEPEHLPIFPLNTVLFPDGILPLRIFEPRYLDMVSACLRNDTGFGVCLIRRGKEVGAAAEPETIGCRARITDWSMEQLGLLQIRTVGTTRFRILDTTVSDAGLVTAVADDLDDEQQVPIPPAMLECRDVLARIIDQLESQNRARRGQTQQSPEHQDSGDRFPVGQPYRLDDSGWVANRLCEFLPISLTARQKLMELTDAPTRLEIVHQHLKQQKII